MKNTHTTKWMVIVLITTVIFACSKQNNDDTNNDNIDKPITEALLCEVNSFTQRIWFMFLAEAVYLSASGSVDSTYAFSPANQKVRFSRSGTGVAGPRVYGIDGTGGVISRFWPGVGVWWLSADGRNLSIGQTAIFPEPGKPGGTFALSYNPNPILLFPYSIALGLKQSTSLADGRKVELRIILGSN